MKLFYWTVDGFYNINGTEYYINSDMIDFHDGAHYFCELKMMKLITFETAEKWQLISTWLNDNGEK